jgi:diketogulonate reductase-like aldo/keto reductase
MVPKPQIDHTGLFRVQLQPERLENNVHAVDWELTREEVAEVNAITNKD